MDNEMNTIKIIVC